ncbi:hypothetical protein M3Y98_00864300 [Aphelenchoides besseyi]|nr:hypothetical protein M3Y98_00864300 [Aphelenchoides besseyi]
MIADMPDLSHLSEEERMIIEQVFQRQKEEEQKETEVAQKADKELDDIEKLINERKENARKLVGTQNDAICQICQKTKFADGIGHKCFHCELRSCARCGGRTTHKNRNIWACSTCQKRQELFARSGKWFQADQAKSGISPSNSQSGAPDEFEETAVGSQSSPQNATTSAVVPQIHRQPSVEAENVKMNGAIPNAVNLSQQPIPQQQQQSAVQPSKPVSQPTRSQTTTQRPPTHQQPTSSTETRRVEQTPSQSKSTALKPQRSYDAHAVRSKTETQPVDYVNGRHPTSTTDPRLRQRTEKSTIARSDPNSRAVRHRGSAVESRVPAVPEGTSMDAYHSRTAGPTTLHGGTRMRRGKLSRQIRSLSSSEDDEIGGVNAVSRRHSTMDSEFSEKDLLKYIYGNQRFTKTSPSVNATGFTTSLPTSRLGLHDINSSTSTPALNYVVAGSTLATKIRQFLQQPVSWQPSADQRRLIGHIILQRPENDNGDLGLKVIGGRHSTTGRLGAFITQVKPGSVADLVGQLRPGDEVLEWNGEILQNLTHEGVYQVISAAKNSPKVELIVSRSAQSPTADDFAHRGLAQSSGHSARPQQHSPVAHSDYGASTGISHPYLGDHYRIPHSKSLVNPQMAFMHEVEPGLNSTVIHKNLSPRHRGNVLGKLEFSLLYLSHERELLITIYQAVDLPPRTNGTLRNPYVKIFLLPNRSEESRRQSKVIYETLNPVWNECFFYYGLNGGDLAKRVLEITVWDYDQYNGHEFLGETVIDLSQILLDNQHFSYPLVDMDDENPLRMRARQSRINSPYGYSQQQERYRSQSATCDDQRRDYDVNSKFHTTGGHYSHAREFLEQDPTVGGHRSKYDEIEWGNNGYLSDHVQSQYSRPSAHNNPYYRRPRSATGFRHIADFETRSSAYRNQPITEEAYDEPTTRSHHKTTTIPQHQNTQRSQPYDPYNAQYPPQGYAPNDSMMYTGQKPNQQSRHQPAAHPSTSNQSTGHQQPHRPMDGMEFMSNRQRELILQEQSGYGSDGSETLSANSAQSMQKRAANREEEQQMQQQMNLQDIPTYSPHRHFYENPANSAYASNQRYPQSAGRQPTNQRGMDEMTSAYNKLNGDDGPQSQRLNGGAEMSGQSQNGGGTSGSATNAGQAALSMKERKKSLMTRLIPGRNAMADGKRTGFARSEEVGIPDSMAMNGDAGMAVPFMKQSSKDSTDSSHSDNFQPVLPDGTLGQFVDNLGPGQVSLSQHAFNRFVKVVGRQALASPVLGEIQLGLYLQDGALIVDIKRAKNLVIRPGTKINPAPYVKVYLMHNKQCIAKAKTQTARKTTAPIFNQKLSFAETYKHRMLQVSVLGDYGRMERRSFMGIAQIRLDDLQLSQQAVEGWYKLFHNQSLHGAPPVRKDSENSLMEIDAMVITTLRRFPPSHGPYYRTVFPKRALDELEGTDFGMKRKRALDMLEGSDFGMRKRSLDLLDGAGFGFDKRALDALEGTDFIGLKKRALDMLDGSDFGMRKRALDMLDGSDFGMRKRALDSLEGSGFGMKKRAVAHHSSSFFSRSAGQPETDFDRGAIAKEKKIHVQSFSPTIAVTHSFSLIMFNTRNTFFLFVVAMISVTVFAVPLSNNAQQRPASRMAWAQFAEWNPSYQNAPVKRWSPLEPSIRFYKRNSAPTNFDLENYFNLLESYNPLYDVHLRQYFALPHMQKHLRSLGLLDSNGVPVAQNSTTNNVESQLYQRHQVMMDMMLRNRERVLMQLADLQKKLDAAEKVEIYRRIRQGITNPEEFRRQHITTRSFSRPARGRQRSSDKSDRQRRHSNSYDESELMKRIESENESAQHEYAQQHKSLYSRLAANAYKYQYLHKLDDRTLLNYKETLRKQLQKLERFREAAFGPHSVAKHQPNPQNSWFFRRRSLPTLTNRTASSSTQSRRPVHHLAVVNQPQRLRPSKSSQRARAGKSMSPPRNRLPTTVHSPQSQPSARTSAQPKPKKASVRKLPPIQKDKNKKPKTTSSSESSENQQKLPPTAVIRPSKKTEDLKENAETENRPSSNSSVTKLPILGAVAAAVGGVAAGLGLSTSDPEPHPEISDTDYSRPETEASGALLTSDADLTDATSPQPQSDVEPEEHDVDNKTPPYEQEQTPKEENTPVQPFAEAPSMTVEEVKVVEKPEEIPVAGYVPAEVEEPSIDQEEEIHVRHTREVHTEPPPTADANQLDDGETLRSDVEMHSPEQPISPAYEKQEEAVYDAQNDVVVHQESDNEDAQSDKTHDAVPENHSIDDFERIQTTESVEMPENQHEETHDSHPTPNQLIDDYGRGPSAMSKDSIEALSHTQAKESDAEQEPLHQETYEPMNVEPEHEEQEFAVSNVEAVNQLEHHEPEMNTGNYEYENSMVDAVHEYDDSLAKQNEEHPEVQTTDHLESDQQVEIEHEEPQREEREVISQQSHKLEDSHEEDIHGNELNENVQMTESIYQQQQEEHPETYESEELIEKEVHQNYSEDPDHRSVSANQENSVVDHQEGGYESEGEDVNQQSEHQLISRGSPVDQNNEMHQSTYQYDDHSIEQQDTEHENVAEEVDQHSEHPNHASDHSTDQNQENENVEMHQSTYDERPHSPEYERYDKHRDSFGEQSESEPNLHYSEPLQPLTTDAMQEYANQYQDEYDNMQVIEGESLRETSDEDTLGRSAQSDRFVEQHQDTENVTAAEPATFESMVVHHDEQNEDVGSVSHESYQHEEPMDEGHELNKRSAEPETQSPPPSSHRSLLVPQPSIEVTPASDYGSTDRLDQIDTANASSTNNQQEAPESQSSQQSSPRTENHELEDEDIETIPPPVSHSPLTADEEPHHLPESPEPHPHSTVIPEQNDENGEALTIPEDDQVVPRDSITDEYVTDSLGLTDGQEPDEHHDYEPMEQDQFSSHYDGNSQDEHTDHQTEETSQSEHAPSTARTENSEETQRHELMSRGYGDEEQTTDLDSYIQQHAHELETHGVNLHDPEQNIVEDELNANINAAAPLHSTIDPIDGNENGVQLNASVEEFVHSNGVNGNGDSHSNGYHHDEHNSSQTYDSRNETPLTRKSVDHEDEQKSEEDMDYRMMFDSLLIVLLLLTASANSEFSDDFRQYLIRTVGQKQMSDLERLDMGPMGMGSFGGKQTANEPLTNRPVVMIHGTTLRAGVFLEHRRFFINNGYNPGELYATTYSDGGLSPLFSKKMECADVKQVRNMILAVSAYTNSTVDVLAYSMGAALSRKAILGGNCVDTAENIGAPIGHLVDTYLAVGGVCYGYESCAINEKIWPACNPVNGMVYRSRFLRDVNQPDQKYEGRNTYAIYSKDDNVVGYECAGNPCSELKNSNVTVPKRGYDHLGILTLTKELQYSIINYFFLDYSQSLPPWLPTSKNCPFPSFSL